MVARRLLAYSDFATAPVAIGAIISGGAALRQPALIALGALAWTLIEYWVHRALHMRRFPRLRALHMRHHQHPAAPSGGTLYSSLIILALVAGAIFVPAAAGAIVGLLIGYLAFIVLHHAEHHGWPLARGPLRRLAAAHARHHHAGPATAFGVSTTLWDRLFGTA